MEFEVRPVRKKRRKIRPSLPFPIVNDETDKIQGIFDGNYVIIHDIEAVRRVSFNGCFGKSCSSGPRPLQHSQTRKLRKLRLFHKALKYSVDESAPNKLNIVSDEAPKLATETSSNTNDSTQTNNKNPEMQMQPQTSAENTPDMETETNGSDNSSSQTQTTDQEMRPQIIAENPPDLKANPEIQPQTSAGNGSLEAPRSVQMDPEEAFFLAHAADCLEILYKDEALFLQDAWSIFRNLKKNFVKNYVAYYYYRSKNWVVKLDTRYGGDLVLYKLGPSHYHSSYVVVIEVLDSNLQRVGQNGYNNLTRLLAINRICESVRKELLICQIICPENMDMSAISFSDISKFSIREVLTKRWISSREREELCELEKS